MHAEDADVKGSPAVVQQEKAAGAGVWTWEPVLAALGAWGLHFIRGNPLQRPQGRRPEGDGMAWGL